MTCVCVHAVGTRLYLERVHMDWVQNWRGLPGSQLVLLLHPDFVLQLDCRRPCSGSPMQPARGTPMSGVCSDASHSLCMRHVTIQANLSFIAFRLLVFNSATDIVIATYSLCRSCHAIMHAKVAAAMTMAWCACVAQM